MGRKDREGYIDPRVQKAKDKYEGMILPTRDGKMYYEIVEYIHSSDVLIHFLGTDYSVHRTAGDVLNNKISNPFPSDREGAVGAVHFEDMKKKWIGCEFKTFQGYMIKIIDYADCDKITVKFLDDYGYTTVTKLCHIKSGSVGNPYHRGLIGGYVGEPSEYAINHPYYENSHQRWYNILRRGTEGSSFRQMDYKSVYDNTCVVPEWYCFATFVEWFLHQLDQLNPAFEYDIDKDLKYFIYHTETNGMRCYGPNYCVLLPHDINCALPTTMESAAVCDSEAIKRLADKYLSQNAITKETYDLIYMNLDYYSNQR